MKRVSALLFCCLFVCVMASASMVHAGGFALYEWSNRGIAMGTTGYANAGDASVIATNPALMTELAGKHALVGAAIVAPQTTVVLDGVKNKTLAKKFVVPHAYYTQQMESNENVWLGIGLFTRFGLGTHYDEKWMGRSALQYVDVKSTTLNPNIAFKFNDNFSAAVGVDILKGSMDLQKDMSRYGGANGIVSFHTEGYGVGANLGLTYKIDDKWTTAFTYRSPIKFDTTGSADVNLSTGSVDTDSGQHIYSTLPSSYTVAVAFEPIEQWTMEFDVLYTRWELTKELSYEGAFDSKTALHYKNTWRFQFGSEFWAKEWLAVRFGYVYDQTPTRAGEASFMLPANDRQLISTGLGYKENGWKVDWSFMYVMTKERNGMEISDGVTKWDVDFENGRTWITGVSVGYEF